MIATLFFAISLLSLYPTALAGPACLRKHQNVESCIQLCSGRFGYPGMRMGLNRWGSVIVPSQEPMEDVIENACKSALYVSQSGTAG